MLKSISLRLCTLIVLLFAGISSFAQQVQVKGTVVEKSSGESIIGASVMEVGSNSNGTITDIDGNFILSVASGATLSVSYIGYKTVTVKAQPILRIELTEDSRRNICYILHLDHSHRTSQTSLLLGHIAGHYYFINQLGIFRQLNA